VHKFGIFARSVSAKLLLDCYTRPQSRLRHQPPSCSIRIVLLDVNEGTWNVSPSLQHRFNLLHQRTQRAPLCLMHVSSNSRRRRFKFSSALRAYHRALQQSVVFSRPSLAQLAVIVTRTETSAALESNISWTKLRNFKGWSALFDETCATQRLRSR